jgi:hypothetical protein
MMIVKVIATEVKREELLLASRELLKETVKEYFIGLISWPDLQGYTVVSEVTTNKQGLEVSDGISAGINGQSKRLPV